MPGKRLLSLLLAVMACAAIAAHAAADSGTENEFLALINSTRGANGLGSLQMEAGLQSHARNHTQDMIAAGDIYHSSSAELSAAGGSGWSKIGENVGRGQSPGSLHDAFMASPGHKANILGDYNYVGIGTDRGGDYLYVTVVFMKKGETGPPPTEAPPATEAPAPPPEETTVSTAVPASPSTTAPATSTSTTVPPTTTTTMIVPPDRPVAPGLHCLEAGRYSRICHD